MIKYIQVDPETRVSAKGKVYRCSTGDLGEERWEPCALDGKAFSKLYRLAEKGLRQPVDLDASIDEDEDEVFTVAIQDTGAVLTVDRNGVVSRDGEQLNGFKSNWLKNSETKTLFGFLFDEAMLARRIRDEAQRLVNLV